MATVLIVQHYFRSDEIKEWQAQITREFYNDLRVPWVLLLITHYHTTMKTLTILTASILTIILSGCGEDIETLPTDSEAIVRKKAGDLIFTLQVLNTDEEPQSAFRKGENFILDFTIENKGKNTVALCDCDLPAVDNFFAVYKVFSDDRSDADTTLIGKPWLGIVGARDMAITGIKGKEKIEYRIPWQALPNESFPAPENNISTTVDYFVPAAQDPLSSGEYTTGFSLQEYSIDGDFAIHFTVL